MRIILLVATACAAFAAPAATRAVNFTFLDQAPIRFFNETDIEQMSTAADEALNETKNGEDVQWRNDQTGNSGTITAVRSYTRQGKDCRQLTVVSRARLAPRGSATSNVDFCKVEGTWRMLTIAP